MSEFPTLKNSITRLEAELTQKDAQIAGLVGALELAIKQIRHHHLNDPCGGCSAARDHIEPVLSTLPATQLERYRLEREALEAANTVTEKVYKLYTNDDHICDLTEDLIEAVEALQAHKEGK